MIDVHQHLWPEAFVDRLRARREPPYLDGWTLHTATEAPYDVDPAAHAVDKRSILQLARREPLAQLPDQSGVCSRVPGPFPLEEEQHGVLGQPQHAALRGDGLPAVPSEDGARRHHRRHAVLGLVVRRAEETSPCTAI